MGTPGHFKSPPDVPPIADRMCPIHEMFPISPSSWRQGARRSGCVQCGRDARSGRVDGKQRQSENGKRQTKKLTSIQPLASYCGLHRWLHIERNKPNIECLLCQGYTLDEVREFLGTPDIRRPR